MGTIFSFLLISALTYWKLIFHFFEQDEWMGMGHTLALGIGRVVQEGVANAFIFGTSRPIAGLINFIFYSLFGFNTVPLAIFAILVHGLSIFLVFKLIEKISPKSELKIFAALFFAVNLISNQAVSWFSSAAAVPVSTAFLLFSILLFLNFIEKNRRKSLYFSYLAFYLSFITKEINALFSIFFVFYFFFYKEKSLKRNLSVNFPYILVSVLAIFRYVYFYFLSQTQVGLIITRAGAGTLSLLANIFSIPISSLSQIFVIPRHIYSLARSTSILLHGFDKGDLFNQTTMSFHLSIVFSLLVILFLIFLYTRKRILKKNLLLGGLFYVLAILPYTVIQKGGTAFLEGRYYYLAVAGIAIIFAGIKLPKYKPSKALLLAIFFAYIFLHLKSIYTVLDNKVALSMRRKEVVKQLAKVDLKNKRRNIFFAESDEEYLGQKLPFQQGIGYTLMVIFHEQGAIPGVFLKENYLWNLGSQGYHTFEDYGFGYFYEPNKLEQTIKELESKHYNLVYLKYENQNLKIEKKDF